MIRMRCGILPHLIAAVVACSVGCCQRSPTVNASTSLRFGEAHVPGPSFAFVLDGSGVMAPYWHEAGDLLHESLSSASEDCKFCILRTSPGRSAASWDGLAPNTETTRSRAARFLRAVSLHGLQNHVGALQAAYSSGASSIVFVGPSLPPQVRQEVRNRWRVAQQRLYVIWFKDAAPGPDPSIEELVASAGGRLLIVSTEAGR